MRYGLILSDDHGQPFDGQDTYTLAVPAGIVEERGYYSITIYGADNKSLITYDKNIYDRTSYSFEQNEDGTYTVTLSANGEGKNAIPTGKPFYAILRAYVPVPGADLTVRVSNE